jgi:hypothetical protein
MMSYQKGRTHWLRRVVIGALLASATMAAQAETITTTLFQSTTMVTSANINLTELDLSTPGTLSVSLTDLKWPSALNALSFTLFDATHVLNPTVQGGLTFNITSAGTFFASIFAAPTSSAKAGLYNVQINFQTSAAAPVPLPAAGWFLLSGIAGLAAIRPKQKLSYTLRSKQKLSQMYA